MAAKFKIGDILILKSGSCLYTEYGWNKNMCIKITSMSNNTSNSSYTYNHLAPPSPNWGRTTADSWSYRIIHDNFEIASRAWRILYG